MGRVLKPWMAGLTEPDLQLPTTTTIALTLLFTFGFTAATILEVVIACYLFWTAYPSLTGGTQTTTFKVLISLWGSSVFLVGSSIVASSRSLFSRL